MFCCKELNRRAFSLVELMVVVAIIGILVAITIPTVKKVRLASQNAATRAQLNNLSAAIQEYYNTFSAYPGPLPDTSSGTGTPYVGGSFSTNPSTPNVMRVIPTLDTDKWDVTLPTLPTSHAGSPPAAAPAEIPPILPYNSITGNNNLVLGLMGGLTYVGTETPPIRYDPARVGGGPVVLSPVTPSAKSAFYDVQNDLSWHNLGSGDKPKRTGYVEVESVLANDCPIPSLMDRYAVPMPLLYLRARPGLNGKNKNTGDVMPTVIGYNDAQFPYNLAHILGYTSSAIGSPLTLRSSQSEGRKGGAEGYHGLRDISPNGGTNFNRADATNFRYPYEANLYLNTPGSPGTPRKKDGFVLISAGPDRIYGTKDDITNFGEVNP